MLSLWLALMGTAYANCPGAKTTSQDVDAALIDGLSAFSMGDETGFNAAWARVLADVSCLDHILSPADAALVHQFAGLHAFVTGNRVTATAAFRRAQELANTPPLPPEVAPTGGPVDRAWSEALSTPTPSTSTIETQGYSLYIDGSKHALRVDGAPAVLQYENAMGELRWSGLVGASGLGPSLEPDVSNMPEELEPLPLLQGSNLDDAPATSFQPNVPLLASAGGVTVVATGLLIGGMSAKGAFTDEVGTCISAGCDSTPEDLDVRRKKANTLGYAAQGTFVVAAGLGIASLTVTW